MLVIPGASALPEFYDPLVKAVTARGYDIQALHIPSVGLAAGRREGALPTMYDDAAFIATHAAQLADAGKDVMLITHSYGGTPGTESIRGLSKKQRQRDGMKGGIVGLAYITSLVPNVGEPASSVQAVRPDRDRVPTAFDVSFLIGVPL